ncbi:MAG: HlyC/CorC family transporter [Phycisphaerales bacterium]|nr:HlyC/CorC family transporter [Phycisphaerales bacterium]
MTQFILIALTVAIVAVNGFFVAAEFALVKVRPSRLAELARQGRPMARTAEWLHVRLDRALSACQLGITMASLGLGWIGEPAVGSLLEPLLHAVGIESAAIVHTLSFIVAFTIITAAHLVIGEQAPKIFAIRRPEAMAIWCALPLRWFYILAYPLLIGLNASTAFLLRFVGIEGVSEHDVPHSESEIRALLSQAHAHGEVTRAEHRLINAVFDFDDTVCRQVMVPRIEVDFLDIRKPIGEAIRFARETMHTRYPLCDGSMDSVLGFVHIKDLFRSEDQATLDLRSVLRAARYVPDTVPISRVLAHFRSTREHMAFVTDEYGSVVGIVTLENVLERIVGSVQDEFDTEMPDIAPDGPRRHIVQGSAPVQSVNRVLGLALETEDVDTMSGLIMHRLGRLAEPGDVVELGDGAVAEVMEVQQARTTRLRLVLPDPDAAPDRAD